MSNREYAVVLFCQGAKVVGFGEGGGEGFLDEDVEVGAEELFGDSGVVGCRDADGCGVDGIGVCDPAHVAMGLRHKRGTEQVCDGGEGGDVVESGKVVAAGGVGLNEGGELDEVGVGEFEFAVDAEVVAPEGAGTDDGYACGRHVWLLR
jgi:hypothetical protein